MALELGLGICLKDIVRAHQRIAQFVHKTPVFTSVQANEKSGRQLFFKAENLQRSGSFKIRGALNAILKLKETGTRFNGVITHSSGNHGQALALAAKLFDIPCYIVIPEMAPKVKKDAILHYGAQLVQCGPKPTDRYETCEKLQKEKNLQFIPPYDHLDIIAGQGTIALEFLDQVPDLDAIFISVSGGGMSSGMAIAAKAKKPSIKRKRLWEGPPQYLNTIADGIRLQQTGVITTPILTELAEKEVFEISDEEMIAAMRFSFERMKLVIEAAAGAAVAAAMSEKFQAMDPQLKKVGVILCGGNTDIDHLPWYT